MSLAADLLDTARRLAATVPATQSDLRRTISTAYYALFHRLIEEAVAVLVSEADQRQVLARQFSHTAMRDVCKLVSKSPIPPAAAPFLKTPLPLDLTELAAAFVKLQERRHSADYDTSVSFILDDALNAVQLAEDAFAQFTRFLLAPAAKPFLLLLLVGEPKLPR